MKSMRKVGSMVAVALAGATLGVGSTFGWWQGAESLVTPENSEAGTSEKTLKPTDRRFDVPTEVRKFQGDVQYFSAGPESKLESTEARGKGKLQILRTKIAAVESHALDRLIQDLESEVKALEEKGQGDAATAQRRVIDRLRLIRKSTPQQDIVTDFQADAGSLKLKTPDELAHEAEMQKLTDELVHLKQKLAHVDDQADRHRLEEQFAEIRSQLERLEQKAKATSSKPKIKVEKRYVATRNDQQQRHEWPQPFPPPHLEIHLGQVADQLEKSGQKDAAQHIREGAERIKRDLRNGRTTHVEHGDLHLSPNTRMIIVERAQEPQEGNSPSPSFEGRAIRYLELGEKVTAPKQEDPRERPDEEQRTEKILRRKMTSAAHENEHGAGSGHDKLHALLNDLRREIAQLRDEVHGLRCELKQEVKDTSAKGPAEKGGHKAKDDDEQLPDEERGNRKES